MGNIQVNTCALYNYIHYINIIYNNIYIYTHNITIYLYIYIYIRILYNYTVYIYIYTYISHKCGNGKSQSLIRKLFYQWVIAHFHLRGWCCTTYLSPGHRYSARQKPWKALISSFHILGPSVLRESLFFFFVGLTGYGSKLVAPKKRQLTV